MKELSKHFPAVDFVFAENKKVSLAPENYLFKVGINHSLFLYLLILTKLDNWNSKYSSPLWAFDVNDVMEYMLRGFRLTIVLLICMQHTKVPGAYCLGFFKNQDSTTLLGGKR